MLVELLGNLRNTLHIPKPPLRVGDIYEDCGYHPVLCTEVVNEGRTVSGSYGWGISGISLFDGSSPRSCSWFHCGVRKLSHEELQTKLKNRDAWLAAEREFRGMYWNNIPLSKDNDPYRELLND